MGIAYAQPWCWDPSARSRRDEPPYGFTWGPSRRKVLILALARKERLTAVQISILLCSPLLIDVHCTEYRLPNPTIPWLYRLNFM
ncbi:hypothetical protein BDW75DRAFT_199362 [Aspergillus navahoensis]